MGLHLHLASSPKERGARRSEERAASGKWQVGEREPRPGTKTREEPRAKMEENVPEATMVEKVQAQMRRKFQFYLDQSTIYLKARWCGFACLLLMYLVRVFTANGWYIVTYGLGIYLLNLFIGFITPQVPVPVLVQKQLTHAQAN